MHVVTDRAGGLRAWAQGSYPLEAAAELLIRALHGRLLAGPWVVYDEDSGRHWFDVEQVTDAGFLSGGELRLLTLAASLADDTGENTVSLNHVVLGLDRANLDLVLAAIAHAGGSHEDTAVQIDRNAGTVQRIGQHHSLHPWPAGQ